ncbi:small subunit ribosomal protein S27Ae [Candidatus Methanophagaceae archaeon]|jgi:small subunit ribosomal protein S27Ae|nr:MAG: 30S ribosomal protein S27ae [Methanophagales archaeon]KAF5431428.1 small subunit ribosomal protein S27Ae [Methanophagales archaeon]KAF5432710.1 small subunit ribosomal protein S27Ae [Methanophagales archaeon]KAF5434961.1 small subunit ribosomal protein S27Ae [Methanophagales archaeon]MEA3488330.1 30S ribosomal protein S27ae [Euryarchaeota archaeon]
MAAIHTLYEVVEEKGAVKLRRKRKVCPRCGAGVFLGEHKDRYSCGKCSYTEYKKK